MLKIRVPLFHPHIFALLKKQSDLISTEIKKHFKTAHLKKAWAQTQSYVRIKKQSSIDWKFR